MEDAVITMIWLGANVAPQEQGVKE